MATPSETEGGLASVTDEVWIYTDLGALRRVSFVCFPIDRELQSLVEAYPECIYFYARQELVEC